MKIRYLVAAVVLSMNIVNTNNKSLNRSIRNGKINYKEKHSDERKRAKETPPLLSSSSLYSRPRNLAPEITNVTPGDGKVTINWKAEYQGITKYRVDSTPGKIFNGQFTNKSVECMAPTTYNILGTCGWPTPALVVTGLTNGTTYTFVLVAVLEGGAEKRSPYKKVTPAGVPDPPKITELIPGDGEVSILWTVPENNGAEITSYTLWWYAVWPMGTSPRYIGLGTGVNTARNTVVTGLTNGTTYTFTLTATNAVGESKKTKLREVSLEEIVKLSPDQELQPEGGPAQAVPGGGRTGDGKEALATAVAPAETEALPTTSFSFDESPTPVMEGLGNVDAPPPVMEGLGNVDAPPPRKEESDRVDLLPSEEVTPFETAAEEKAKPEANEEAVLAAAKKAKEDAAKKAEEAAAAKKERRKKLAKQLQELFTELKLSPVCNLLPVINDKFQELTSNIINLQVPSGTDINILTTTMNDINTKLFELVEVLTTCIGDTKIRDEQLTSLSQVLKTSAFSEGGSFNDVAEGAQVTDASNLLIEAAGPIPDPLEGLGVPTTDPTLEEVLDLGPVPTAQGVLGNIFANRSLKEKQLDLSGFSPLNLGDLNTLIDIVGSKCPEENVTIKAKELIDIIKSIDVSGDYEDNYIAVAQANYDKVLTTIDELEELCPF